MRWIGVILFLGWSSLVAQEVKITATVDKNPVGLDEEFTYTVEISGETRNLPEVELPELEHFTVIAGPSVSTSFQMINFKMSASRTYQLVLLPKKVGTFTIPPAEATYKGETIRSNAIELTVTRQARRSRSAQRGRARSGDATLDLSKNVFLKAVPSKKSVYLHEQVNLVYKIYFRLNIQNPEYIKLPETVGFWVEEYPLKSLPVRQETINGVPYNVVEVRKLALFPTRTGELKITPMKVAVDVIIRQRRRDPFDIFDDFFDSPFGKRIRRVLTSNEVTIQVNPLPAEGRPKNFGGLVGDFRVVTSLDRREVETNQAISYTIKISGSGHLDFLNQLPVQFPATFEVYDPKIKSQKGLTGRYMSTSKTYEYVLIPRVPGEYKIPAFQIPFFDPFREEYRILRTPEYRISVKKGAGFEDQLAGTIVAKEDVKFLGKDIRFIKDRIISLQPMGYRPYRSWWFWMGVVLPVLGLLLAYGYREHLEKMQTNVEYARRRRANKQARQRLKEAQKLLKQQKYAEFYAEISRALLGYLADKTNQPAAGLLREDVEALLKKQQVNGELLNRFLKCLDDADFRRFAPARVTPEEARASYQQAEKILEELEKYF
ncbi:MAG: protein BatD [Calditrichaeota bacterium]|nr:protein BatD [Calditrichota bacterium]